MIERDKKRIKLNNKYKIKRFNLLEQHKKTEDFNLSTGQREALKKNVGSLLENLDTVSNSKEFSEVKEQLDTLNLQLNIDSPEEKEFIKHFNDKCDYTEWLYICL